MTGPSHHRVMVRTCNGLELQDPTMYAGEVVEFDAYNYHQHSSADLVDFAALFPSAGSRDELTPR